MKMYLSRTNVGYWLSTNKPTPSGEPDDLSLVGKGPEDDFTALCFSNCEKTFKDFPLELGEVVALRISRWPSHLKKD